jgi:hypothetical protein
MDRAVPGRLEDSSCAGMTPSTSFMLGALLCGAVAIPPFVDSPLVSRLDFHCLYLVRGNLSLTSSMDISFFSLLLRCGRGMVAISMGSPFSPAATAARRRLYLKQYLTPTMILERLVWKTKKKGIHGECAYHRLVKTTPNPRATKNSRGELVGPPPFPLPLLAPVAGSWVELGAIVGAVAVKTAAEDMLVGSGF